jgi:hypothetical protein
MSHNRSKATNNHHNTVLTQHTKYPVSLLRTRNKVHNVHNNNPRLYPGMTSWPVLPKTTLSFKTTRSAQTAQTVPQDDGTACSMLYNHLWPLPPCVTIVYHDVYQMHKNSHRMNNASIGPHSYKRVVPSLPQIHVQYPKSPKSPK